MSRLETSHERAFHALRVSDEHIHALHRVWKSYGGNLGLIAPQHTIARSALIGAAHAYWVLQPRSSEQRAARALLIARKDLRESLSRYDDLLSDAVARSALGEDLPELAVESREATQRGIDAASAELKRIDGSAGDPRDTTIIRDSVLHLRDANEEQEEPLLLLAAMTAWRNSSAHAHAYRWQTLPGAPIRREPASGRLIQTLTPQLDDLGQVAGLAHLLYKGAWDRWDELSSSQRGTAFGEDFVPIRY